MERKQINKLRMYESVNAGFLAHTDSVAMMGDLVQAHEKLQNGLARIRQYRQVQEADLTGLTRGKAKLRGELVLQVYKFSVALVAHSTVTQNLDLKARAGYSLTELKSSPDPILYDIGMLIRGLAEPVMGELAKYFIDEGETTSLDRLLADFKLHMPQRRNAGNDSKVSTGNISIIFNELDKLLKDEVDVLMTLFQFSQPDFYASYRNARSIVNYSGRGKAAPVPAT